MSAPTRTAHSADHCELCGHRGIDGTRDRIRHLRTKHPAYARGVLLRVLAPPVFLLELLALSAAGAPGWAYLAAAAATVAAALIAIRMSRVERARTGARPGIGANRLLREGGLAFMLVIPAVVLLLIALAGRR